MNMNLSGMNIGEFALAGILMGLTAGISPGPLLNLVVSETLRHGRKKGFRVAIAPLITDLPIILVSLFALSTISGYKAVLGIVSFAGSLFVAWLGFESLLAKKQNITDEKINRDTLKKAILVNFLNPHPYLFWITIGSPLVLKASKSGLTTVVIYFFCFYFFLVGSKIAVTLLVDRSRNFLSGKIYTWLLRILGLSLLVFSVLFFMEGIKIFSGLN